MYLVTWHLAANVVTTPKHNQSLNEERPSRGLQWGIVDLGFLDSGYLPTCSAQYILYLTLLERSNSSVNPSDPTFNSFAPLYHPQRTLKLGASKAFTNMFSLRIHKLNHSKGSIYWLVHHRLNQSAKFRLVSPLRIDASATIPVSLTGFTSYRSLVYSSLVFDTTNLSHAS